MKKWHVYEIYLDGHLLYIGSGSSPAGRKSHCVTKWMLPVRTNVQVVASFADRKAARAVEADRIKSKRPPGNFAHNRQRYATKAERDIEFSRLIDKINRHWWYRGGADFRVDKRTRDEIRRRVARGEKISAVARRYKVARGTVINYLKHEK